MSAESLPTPSPPVSESIIHGSVFDSDRSLAVAFSTDYLGFQLNSSCNRPCFPFFHSSCFGWLFASPIYLWEHGHFRELWLSDSLPDKSGALIAAARVNHGLVVTHPRTSIFVPQCYLGFDGEHLPLLLRGRDDKRIILLILILNAI